MISSAIEAPIIEYDEPVYSTASIVDSILLALPAFLGGCCICLPIPLVIQDSAKKDKVTLTYILSISATVVMFVVLALGIIAGSALETSQVPSVCVMAWIGYAFGEDEQGIGAIILEKILVLLPTLSTLVNGPLIALSLVENLRGLLPRARPWMLAVGVWIIPGIVGCFMWSFTTLVSVSSVCLTYMVIVNTSLV